MLFFPLFFFLGWQLPTVFNNQLLTDVSYFEGFPRTVLELRKKKKQD